MKEGTKAKHRFLRVISGLLLGIIGIWALLLLVLQFILTPSVSGRIVDRYASEYIDGNLEFEKIRINMFRHFPSVGLILENGSLTYPSERFEAYKGQGGRLAGRGSGETVDTLASFKRFSLSINVISLLGGKMDIPRAVLSAPRIFAHSYDESTANWNIFRASDSREDSSGLVMPEISLGRIRLVDRPYIVYTDNDDTVSVRMNVKKISFNGRILSGDPGRNKIGLSVDSLRVSCRTARDTVNFRLDELNIHEHGDHIDISLGAKAALRTREYGRLHIPINIKGTAAVREDSIRVFSLNNFKADIASVPINFDMRLEKSSSGLGYETEFSINNCRIGDIIDDFLKNIIPESRKIDTDASFSLSGRCIGDTGEDSFPEVEAELSVPLSVVRHPDFAYEVRLAFGAGIKTENGRYNLRVNKADIATDGLRMKASGVVEDLMGDDPLIFVDGNLNASADSLARFLPDSLEISASGDLSAEIRGSIRMSQMNLYNFSNADFEGVLQSRKLVFNTPKDSIRLDVDELSIKLAPEVKTSVKDLNNSVRLMGAAAELEKADFVYKDVLKFRASKLSLSAKNSAEAISRKDSTTIYPLGGRISAYELVLEDSRGASLTLDENSSSFQMIPKTGNAQIPVLSLSCANKRIFLRNQDNRIILTDSKIQFGAVMNSIERRMKRKAVMDSLAMAHPDVPLDSLRKFARPQRKKADPAEEDELSSGDIDFTLEGVAAKYFRQWDINGDIDVRTGIIMTPYLPIRNIIKNLELDFTNDEINLSNFQILSGNSKLGFSGSLTGLRRALFGRGAYELELKMSSEKIKADELLAAVGNGRSYTPQAAGERQENISDAEFLKMVISDTTDAAPVSPLIIVPANLNANITVDADNISFSDLLINEFDASCTIRERCLLINNSAAMTNMGSAQFEGFYATRNKDDIKTGFSLDLHNVTSEKVIAMMPAIDSLMPLLKSFKGRLDCELAATAELDSSMNVIMPSIDGLLRIEGENLTLSENELSRNLASKLKFENTNEIKISNMTVEGIISDNQIEIFPFVIYVDRYCLALSGIHNLDMSYRYHASLLDSPMLFKLGIDIYGPNFDDMKFKIGRPKYKSTDVPVFTEVIDQARINLVNSIRNIYTKGIDRAIEENAKMEVIQHHKDSIGYVNAAEQKIEEFSAVEKALILEKENIETLNTNE